MRKTMAFGMTLVTLAAWMAPGVAAAQENHWPQWRGPEGTGVAVGDAPSRWSETENVKWRVAVPGRGFSTPVIWGDRIFLTTAVLTGSEPAGEEASPADLEPDSPQRRRGQRGRGRGGGGRGGGGMASFFGGGGGAQEEHSFEVHCYDRATGDLIWKRVATVATPHEAYHPQYGSFASNSPVTDGERVYAHFGSRGTYCYDMDGNLVWEKNFGVQMQIRLSFGEGTAPTLYEDRLILKFDHQGQSFLTALNKLDGEVIWRTDYDEQTSWSQPVVVEHASGRQIVTSASGLVRAYDYETGELIWQTRGLGSNVIPNPIQLGDLVYVMSGHRPPTALMAIELGRTGDLTGSDAIAWQVNRGTSYTASPALHEGKIYFLTDTGMVSCVDAATGEVYYGQRRLPGNPTLKASPIAAGGKLYIAGEDGNVHVLKLGAEYELLATNSMGDHLFVASPIVVEGELFLRSATTLFCISEAAGR